MANEIWLCAKYNDSIFLNKDPDGDGGDGPLNDVQLWEECEIVDMSWIQKKGWNVGTKLTDGMIDGEQQVHSMNATLHATIRFLTINRRRMITRMGQEPGEDAADGEPHVWNKVQRQALQELSERREFEDSSCSDDDGTDTSN